MYVHVRPLAEYLRQRGHCVVLACSEDPGEAGQSFVPQLREQGFDVVVIPMRRAISLWADAKAVFLLYRYLRAHRFDIVHVHTAKAGIIGRVAAWLAGVSTVVYTSHGFSFHPYLSSLRVWFYALLERSAARLCDVITVVSDAVRNRGLAFRVAPPEKIRVISNGVDTDRFDPVKYEGERLIVRREWGLQPDAVVLGTLCRLVPDKGLDCLLRAIAILVRGHQEVHCVICGDGLLRNSLENMARELNISKHVIFTGYRRDIPRLLAALDVFILPTRREGFGLSFVEAMSMEVPVIGSRISPLTELIVDGKTGFLAEVDSPEAFVAVASRLVASKDLRCQMGKAGRAHVIEKFGQRRMCEAYERLFLEYHGQLHRGSQA